MEWWEKLTEVERILYRELYKKDLYEFVKEFWSCSDPAKFVDGILVQFYCEVFQYMCKGFGTEYKPLDINVPAPSDKLKVIDVRQGDKRNININVPP